jgi:hypothetical protein
MKNNDEKIVGCILNEVDGVWAQPKILKNNSDSVQIEAVLQDFIYNRNKRYYTEELITEALQAPHIKELISHRSWVGEAGHPLVKDIKRQLNIDHARVSHVILEKQINSGRNVTGIIESAMFQFGYYLRDSIRQAMEVAFSMRGVAPLKKKKDGFINVQRPLKLLTYDWVFYPSHASAYQTKILREDTNFFIEEKKEYGVIPITESAMLDFIANESDDVSSLFEGFKIDDSISLKKTSFLKILTPDDTILTISENGETFNIKIEEKLVKTEKFRNFLKNIG